ncbi:MAG: HAD family phosphatase [Isosphaeraceae bacterium]|nr:HAD family phosphatase [Isosphaeraceae bacterium]
MPPRALLFDFDGVLADTENIHVAAWERTFGMMGWDIPPEVCARAAEEDDRVFLADVFARRSIQGGDVEGWVRRKQELTRALLADSPRVYPGVHELVQRIGGRTRLAVVSGTWRENIEAVLRSADLADAFELIIAKEDISAPKPDPSGYQLALKRLGLSPPDALALEDSPSGLAAARAASIPCLAIGHRRPAGDWTEECPYLPDLQDTETIIKVMGI